MSNRVLRIYHPLGNHQLGVEHRGAGRAADCIVPQHGKLYVKHIAGTNPPDADGHPATSIPVQARLGPIRFGANDEGRLGSGR